MIVQFSGRIFVRKISQTISGQKQDIIFS